MSDLEGEILDTYIEMGARCERQAIVAWLRVQPFLIKWPWAAAAGIERGEHLRGDDG